MTTFSEQFNTDNNAMMSDAWDELFTPETGTAFLAQITEFRSEPVEDYSGKAAELVAELRWQVSAFAEPTPTFKFLQQKTGKYWSMREVPENSGGEIIATVYQYKRARTGAE